MLEAGMKENDIVEKVRDLINSSCAAEKAKRYKRKQTVKTESFTEDEETAISFEDIENDTQFVIEEIEEVEAIEHDNIHEIEMTEEVLEEEPDSKLL